MISSVRTSPAGLKAATRALGAAAGNAVNARRHISTDDAAVEATAAGNRTGNQDEAEFDRFMPHVVYEAPADNDNDADSDVDGDADGPDGGDGQDMTAEQVQMQQAKALYGANAEVLQTTKSLLGMVVNDRA